MAVTNLDYFYITFSDKKLLTMRLIRVRSIPVEYNTHTRTHFRKNNTESTAWKERKRPNAFAAYYAIWFYCLFMRCFNNTSFRVMEFGWNLFFWLNLNIFAYRNQLKAPAIKRMRGEVEFIDFMLAWSDNRHFDSRMIIKLGNVSELLLHGLAWQRKKNQWSQMLKTFC